MSPRERFLIILLAAVVILLGGFKVLIEPELNKLNRAMEDNTAALSEWIAAQNNNALADSAAESNAKLKEKILDESTLLFPEIKPSNLQVFFNSLAVKSGVSYISYTATSASPASITVPSSQKQGINYPAKDAATEILGENEHTSADKAKTDVKTPSSGEQVEMVAVSLQFTSTYAQATAFLQAVRDSSRMMRVSSLSITENSGILSTGITVECFGLKKLDADSFGDNPPEMPMGKGNPFS